MKTTKYKSYYGCVKCEHKLELKEILLKPACPNCGLREDVVGRLQVKGITTKLERVPWWITLCTFGIKRWTPVGSPEGEEQ
jgi:DNA-directed RNA polymerase subunit RPC12/RpoP